MNNETLIFCYLINEGISLVACGVWHTVAVASDTYDVYSWGWNKYGQCGVSVTAGLSHPYPYSTSSSSFTSTSTSPARQTYPSNENIPVDPLNIPVNPAKHGRKGSLLITYHLSPGR